MSVSSCAIDSGLRDDVLSHTIDIVSGTKVEDVPFPHFAIRGFFPRDVYSEMLGRLPSAVNYEAFDYEKHSSTAGESNRKRFRLENSCLTQLTEDDARFWASIRSALGARELKQAVFDSLREGIACRFGCQPEAAVEQPGYALPEIFREMSGYRIKPHPDTRKKVVTMQIALPQDASQEQLGTEFYRRNLAPRAWLSEPRGFDVVKRMPFVPNAAYAFVVLNTSRLKSWHGRSTLADSSGVRDTILNIWYAKPEHGNQEILAEQKLEREQEQLTPAA